MRFITDENGAVTVDWVVLTAALVGLGLATMGVVSSGVEDVSSDIDGSLQSTPIYTSFSQRSHSALWEAGHAYAVLTGDGYETVAGFDAMIAEYAAMTDEDLTAELLDAADNHQSNQAYIDGLDPVTEAAAAEHAWMSEINAHLYSQLEARGVDVDTALSDGGYDPATW